MAKKIRQQTRVISTLEYRAAAFNIVNFHVSELLARLPNAQMIEIRVIEQYEEPEGTADYTEGGLW